MAMSMLSPRREASIRSSSSARMPPSVTTFRRPSSVLAAEGAEVECAAGADREGPRLTVAAGATDPLAPTLAVAGAARPLAPTLAAAEADCTLAPALAAAPGMLLD